MPILLAPDISDLIREISDEIFPQFIGFPVDQADSAAKWANIVDLTASGVIPASLTASPAKDAFETAFTAIDANLQNGLIVFPASFAAYAGILAAGMAPGFVGVPPAASIDVSPVIPLGLGGASAQVCALALANIIYLWFITGTATPSGGGSAIPWS